MQRRLLNSSGRSKPEGGIGKTIPAGATCLVPQYHRTPNMVEALGPARHRSKPLDAPIDSRLSCELNRAIPNLAERFGVPVGLSDHALGTAGPVAGAAMSACILEKQLTLPRAHPGPDSAFSIEPLRRNQIGKQ